MTEREMRMRDRARRRRDSRGRYMRDRNYRNEMNDMSRGRSMRDRGMDYGMGRDYRGMDYGQHGSASRDYNYSQSDMARGRRDYESGVQYDMASRSMRDGHYPMEFHGQYGDMPFYVRGGRDYNYDYGYPYDYGRRDYGEDKLSEEELEEWTHKLMRELDQNEKEMFKMDRVISRAKEMNVEFGKYFSEEEFYTTVLMVYTDYRDTVGRGILETYLSLAKDWLIDKDSAVVGGEKLALYYDEVICAD